MHRRLVITVSATGFVAESDYSKNGVDWSNLSRTMTTVFPLYIVARMRPECRVIVRAF